MVIIAHCFSTATSGIDWRTARDRIDLAAVATRLLGPAPGRRGSRGGRRSWWPCPLGTHEDSNPSFCIGPGSRRWRCFGCGQYGDAADLVMRIRGTSFPETVRYLTDHVAEPNGARSLPAAGPQAAGPPEGLTAAEANGLVAEAERALATPEGAGALAYLKGCRRGLTDETIRAARLGYLPEGRHGVPAGIVVPWHDGDALTLVKLRQRGGRRPKYVELYRDRTRHAGVYPGRQAIVPGRPLVIAEGEFDVMLLSQELSGLASAVTLGSAGDRPGPGLLAAMLAASPWYVATDADDAGDRAAAAWPASARRIRPPGPFKDWSAAHHGGVGVRRWWTEALAGRDRPALFTWPELAALRWGPNRDDPGPGIVLDVRLGPAEAAAADAEDDYALAERAAICEEDLVGLTEELAARGIRLDGCLVHPGIALGAATGRVAYSGPALQSLPKAERLARIGPVVAGRTFVRADYGQVEPRILLAILRRRGLIGWDVGPGEDLYRVLADAAVDRDAAKVIVNKAINGGRPDGAASGRLVEFIAATDAYRRDLASAARARGWVETLAGRPIRLAADEDNHAGKAVNRVVQGTAADVLHRAALAIERALRDAGTPAAVAFLLFDEVWVECDPAVVAPVAALVRAEMEAAARADGLAIPARIAD